MRAYTPYVATCPLQRLKRGMRSRVGVITELVDARALRGSPVFHDCFAAFDADHQLVANVGDIAPGLPGSTILLFGRSRRQRTFVADASAGQGPPPDIARDRAAFIGGGPTTGSLRARRGSRSPRRAA
jgi:hypothetical protein